jgi:hypothetical protein
MLGDSPEMLEPGSGQYEETSFTPSVVVIDREGRWTSRQILLLFFKFSDHA